ncbi:unnamed protein product [Ixodes pacificus]
MTADQGPESRLAPTPRGSELTLAPHPTIHSVPFPLSLRFQILRPKQKQPPPPFESQRKVGRVREERERERDGAPQNRQQPRRFGNGGSDVAPVTSALINRLTFFFFFFFHASLPALSRCWDTPLQPPPTARVNETTNRARQPANENCRPHGDGAAAVFGMSSLDLSKEVTVRTESEGDTTACGVAP